MINRFVLNEVSYFGPGAREVLPKEISRLGLKKAFVATDKDLIKFGVADKVLSVLRNANIPYEVFSEIKPNPTVSNVKAGLAAYAASGADFIIAIGGGSSMDTAKAIGIITNNPEFSDVVSLEGVADTKKKSVPIIALPTTAGTAAEVTINYVITDEENHKKMVCVDPNDIPAIAIVDAELMYTLPKSLTAATGLDALTHAIEGLITKGAWEMSDMFEIKAIEMIARYLETAVNEPNNAEARNGMAVAQYIAGMAFSNVGLGVVQAIFDIPHGVANALLLPTIMEFNAPAALDKYVDIAKAMNVYSAGMTKEEAADAAVKAVKELSVRVGIPQHLSELGIKAEDLPRLAKAAYADVCTPGNPREVTEEIILDLYNIMITNEQIEKFISEAHRVGDAGLTICSSGNISWRIGDEVLLSGTGSWVPSLPKEKVAICKLETGEVLNGVKPSMEHGFHLGVLRERPDVNVVLHFQSPYATAVACMKELPKDYNVTAEVPCHVGSEIPVVPYYRPGSKELAEGVISALKDHNSVLLKKHGQVVCGKDFDEAFERAMFFEMACRIIILTGGKYETLTNAEIDDLETYVLGKKTK